MTMLWSEWELEDEVGPAAQYLPAPRLLSPVRAMAHIDGYGRAEIRAHNKAGIRGGLVSLAEHPGKYSKTPGSRPRVLITYLPVDSSNEKQNEGKPAKIRVFMTNFTAGAVPPPSHEKDRLLAQQWWENLLARQWWDLGVLSAEDLIPMDWTDKRLLGIGTEPRARNLFRDLVLVPAGRNIWKNTGGNRQGSDVRWNELAEFYRELGKLGGDPFYAELASELASLR